MPSLLLTFRENLNDNHIMKIIYGPSGSGKTVLLYDLLTNVKGKKYVYGLKVDLSEFDIHSFSKFSELPYNCTVVLDDMAIVAFARNTGNAFNKFLNQYLTVARQPDHNIFLLIQNLAMLDLGLLRPKTEMLLQKTSFKAQGMIEMDRDEWTTKLLDGHNRLLREISEPSMLKYYAYVHELDFFYRHGLPPFWTEDLGRPYRDWYREQEF